MKNIISISVVVIIAALMTSCGINYSAISNLNQNSTQVHLTNNNFKVVDKVVGTSDVSHVLIFGGMNKRHLYEDAYADMMNKANFGGNARALVNIVTEEHIGGFFPIYFTRTVTVSANVIEFTK